jgi:hypothetical protein
MTIPPGNKGSDARLEQEAGARRMALGELLD